MRLRGGSRPITSRCLVSHQAFCPSRLAVWQLGLGTRTFEKAGLSSIAFVASLIVYPYASVFK